MPSTIRAPFIKVRIYYQNDLNTALMGPALVDSGATGLLMSKRFADRWGIDITTLDHDESAGASTAFDIYKCTGFKIAIMGFTGDIEVDGVFTDCGYPPFPLLGIKTIFQHYKVTIDALGEAIELEPY